VQRLEIARKIVKKIEDRFIQIRPLLRARRAQFDRDAQLASIIQIRWKYYKDRRAEATTQKYVSGCSEA